MEKKYRDPKFPVWMAQLREVIHDEVSRRISP